MSATSDSIIRDAISHKLLIEFDYDGYHRVAEPHVYGKKSDRIQLLAYQTEGKSASYGLPEWRRFDVARMSNLKLTDRHFPGRRPTISGEHSSFDNYLLLVS